LTWLHFIIQRIQWYVVTSKEMKPETQRKVLIVSTNVRHTI